MCFLCVQLGCNEIPVVCMPVHVQKVTLVTCSPGVCKYPHCFVVYCVCVCVCWGYNGVPVCMYMFVHVRVCT